jgi:hypothetical protein
MFSIVMPPVLPVHNVMSEIVKEVTALAKGGKVYKYVIVFIAIQVSYSKHYDCASKVLNSFLITESITIYRTMNPIPLKRIKSAILSTFKANNHPLVCKAAEFAAVMVTLQY